MLACMVLLKQNQSAAEHAKPCKQACKTMQAVDCFCLSKNMQSVAEHAWFCLSKTKQNLVKI
jgi:hypothetical protein